MGDRLLRKVERWLMPWFDRDEHEQETARGEAIRQRSIKARIDAEQVRSDYAAMSRRLARR